MRSANGKMLPTIFQSPAQGIGYKGLNRARRAFTLLSLKYEPVALVREKGMDYEVTFSHGNSLICRLFGDFTQVEKYLFEAFPGNSSLPIVLK